MKRILTMIVLLATVAMGYAQTFTIVSPGDSAVVDFNSGMPSDTATITWTPLAGATDYNFHLDTLGGAFDPPTWTSANVADTVLKVTFGALDSILGTLAVDSGDTVTLIWTVTANAADTVAFADTAFVISFVRFQATRIEAAAFTELTLFPNPAQTFVHIRATLPQAQPTVSARLTDLMGRAMWQQEIPTQGQSLDARIDLPALPAGIYLLQLRTEAGRATQQIEVY